MDEASELNSALAGRYRIEREIGRGGMATVYVAHDLRHEREVALKVLDPELAAVVGKERFLSEIRVTARLQHPHLLPLFDSGIAENQLFYVMPYVEGESLRALLNNRRQLPIEEAVRIAIGVGSALGYAHRHGVVHRDLKPENILLHEGEPLVADFGIALALSAASTARITQTGVSLGTPQYMSPEQATGDRVIDGRTDIYSLGAVLYEMLTGEPPYTGSSAQAVIAKVVTDKPRPLRAFRDTIPPHVEAAVDRALAKIPADRFDTAQDFVDALRGTRTVALSDPGSKGALTPPGLAPRGRAWRSKLVVGALVAVGFAIGAAAMRTFTPTPPASRPIRFMITQNDSARFRNPPTLSMALARDGSRIVYVGGDATKVQLFVHELDELDAKPIRGLDESELPEIPVLSPDGRNVLYRAGGGYLKRVPVDGGAPVVLADSGTSYSWGDNGVILLYVPPARLFQTSDGAATPRLVATAPRKLGFITFGFPYLLPGSNAALLTMYKGEVAATTAYLGAVRLSDGQVIDLQMSGSNPRYAAGYVFFARPNGSIFAAPFDADKLRITGAAAPVLDNVIVKGTGSAEFGVSDNGTLVYRSGVTEKKLMLVDLHGKETQLLPQLRDYGTPRFSPDGKRLAVAILGTERTARTWIYDKQSGALTRLTDNGGDRPEWSPDGLNILSNQREAGTPRFVKQRWDGSDAPQDFLKVPEREVLELSVPSSGKGYLAARVGAPSRDIWIAPVDSPQAVRPFLATRAEEMMPSVSPDGKWLAYVSNESGRSEVYVRPMPGPGRQLQISTDGGMEPLWSPKRRELFYRGSGKIILARITNLETSPSVTREDLFDDVYVSVPVHSMYGVSPDGTTLVFSKPAGGETKTVVVLNWLDEVRRKLAAAR
ncbi:MAG: protein kinase domain-containing protein [Gemmatimonadaceae bacterium]